MGCNGRALTTYFLPRVVGLEKAMELIFLGDTLDASEALRIGLVGKVVPHEELGKATMEMAICSEITSRTQDWLEGVKAFTEKRKPVWEGK